MSDHFNTGLCPYCSSDAVFLVKPDLDKVVNRQPARLAYCTDCGTSFHLEKGDL
jgi:hypothetical protein